MRDLIDRHDAFGRAMMADLTGHRKGHPDCSDPRCIYPGCDCVVIRHASAGRSVVHSGSGHGTPPLGLDAHFARIHDGLDAVYGEAKRRMVSVPLVSAEPWVEGDDAYRERLGLTPGRPSYTSAGEGLDFLGRKFGLPRARLVPSP